MSADPSSDPTASLDALGVRYPVLLLDFGGVCIPHPFEIPELFAAAFGLDLASMAAAAGADPSDPRSDPNWQRQQAGEITERQYWAIRAEQVGRLVTGEPWGLQEFFHRFHNDVESAALVRHDADVVVDAALDAGCRVAILTNDLRHFAGERFVAENPFVAKCDPLIDADLTGFMKPDPRAYQGALAASGTRRRARCCSWTISRRTWTAVGPPACRAFSSTPPTPDAPGGRWRRRCSVTPGPTGCCRRAEADALDPTR